MARSLPRSQRQYVHVHNAPAQRRARALEAARGLLMPDFIEPALATLRPKAPKGGNWVHERHLRKLISQRPNYAGWTGSVN